MLPAVSQNVSLKPYNSLRFDVLCEYWASAHNLEELLALREWAKDKQLPIMLLGGGSNIILTKPIQGLVIDMAMQGKELQVVESGVQLTALAGEQWHQLVRATVEQGLSGLENLSLIPGNVGAAPIQNIGAYGVELKDTLTQVRALHLPTSEVHTFNNADCGFAYRESIFKRKYKGEYAILDVTFKLMNASEQSSCVLDYGAVKNQLGERKPSPVNVSDAICELRSNKLPDPNVLPNAGSFFKNPVVNAEHAEELTRAFPELVAFDLPNGDVKLAAGWLIENAGFKGKRYQGVGVYDKQALVLVNYSDTQADGLMALAANIQHTVRARFSVDLEIEPNIY